MLEGETHQHLAHLRGLSRQLFGSRSALFGTGGVLLGDLINLGNPLVDLPDPLCLLGTGGGNLGHQVGDLADPADDRLQGLGGLVGDGGAVGGLLNRPFDQLTGLLRRLGTAGGQIADFFGDDSKPFAMLPGTGGFDGGVQRQQVGLEGDLVDDLDDLGNTLTGVVDLGHGGHHRLHLLTPLLGRCPGFSGQLIGGVGVLGVGAGLGRELIQ